MFWSFVLPFQITVALSFVLIVVIYHFARKNRWRRLYSGLAALLVAGVAFIPSCTVVHVATNPFRFGRFSAADVTLVRSSQVRRYLPPLAKNLDMITTNHGHHTRYDISKDDPFEWINMQWKLHGDRSPMPRAEAAFAAPTKVERVDPALQELEMDADGDYLYFQGPYAGNWAGSQIWYDEQSQTAWQRTGYW